MLSKYNRKTLANIMFQMVRLKNLHQTLKKRKICFLLSKLTVIFTVWNQAFKNPVGTIKVLPWPQ